MMDERDLREAFLSIARDGVARDGVARDGAGESAAPDLGLDERSRARILDAVSQRGPDLVAQGIHPDQIQTRLSDLADESSPTLDAVAQASLLRRVERAGPALVRASRRRRLARWLLPAAAAVALVPITYLVVSPDGSDRGATAATSLESPARQSRTLPAETLPAETPRATAGATAGSTAAAPPTSEEPARACERWTPAEGFADSGRLDLGARGYALVRGQVSVSAVSGCATELSLGAGRVRVHAEDLGGGSLTVVAGQTSVEVWGTQFVVSREGPQVRVEVIEGHVVVRTPEERELHLRAGERWARGQREPRSSDRAEPAAREAGLASSGSRRERGSGPGPREDRSIAQLARAETLWRSGRRDRARALFREVGRGRTARAAAAWVRLARLELRIGNPERAVHASRAHRARFPRSPLGAEALFIEIEALRRLGRSAESRAAVERLQSRYPSSPQARAMAQTDGDP